MSRSTRPSLSRSRGTARTSASTPRTRDGSSATSIRWAARPGTGHNPAEVRSRIGRHRIASKMNCSGAPSGSGRPPLASPNRDANRTTRHRHAGPLAARVGRGAVVGNTVVGNTVVGNTVVGNTVVGRRGTLERCPAQPDPGPRNAQQLPRAGRPQPVLGAAGLQSGAGRQPGVHPPAARPSARRRGHPPGRARRVHRPQGRPLCQACRPRRRRPPGPAARSTAPRPGRGDASARSQGVPRAGHRFPHPVPQAPSPACGRSSGGRTPIPSTFRS